MRRRAVFIFFASVIALTGCWDRTEINDLAFVIATAVDKSKTGNYDVSTQIPLPSSMGGSGSSGGGGGTSGGGPYLVAQGSGRNIEESYRNLQVRMSRKLYFAHRRVLVIGEEMAKEGIRQPIETVLIQPQSRLSTFLLIAEGQAQDLLKTQPKLEKLPGEAMREMAKNNLGITIMNAIQDIERPGKVAVIPVIRKSSEMEADKKGKEIIMEDYALLWRDRLAVITKKKESEGIPWLFEKMNKKAVSFNVQPKKEMSVQIIQNSIRKSYSIKNGKPSFTLRVAATGTLMDNESDLQLDDRKTYLKVKRSLEKEIAGQIRAILKRAHQENLDVAGLGWHIYRNDHKTWDSKWKNNWDEGLRNLDVTIKVDADIQRMNNSGLRVKE